MIRLLGQLLLLAISSVVCADTRRSGDYQVYYTVFPSTVIPAEVASQHKITRANNRMVVNISIRKDDEPVEADLSGTVTNLLEQEVELSFTEVIEQEAIYYLANQVSLPDDILRFKVMVLLPDNTSVPLSFIRRYD